MNPLRLIGRRLLLLVLLLMHAAFAGAQERPFTFGVVSQRSAVLTAQYWNPILRYVSQHSGVPLVLKLAKTGTDHARMIQLGELDFVYSNHNFKKESQSAGYIVIAKTRENDIQGQLVVLADSPITSLSQLQGKEVVFPSRVAFAGYYIPLDTLIRSGITVKPLFAGTQEGAMGQLVSGRAVAAAVNSQVASDFAERQHLGYRVLWSSEKYPNMPVSMHPSVPADKASAVRDALLHMHEDREGAAILATSAALIRQKPPFGFVPARNSDFESIRRFYQNSVVREGNP